jgi:hypothetical protein
MSINDARRRSNYVEGPQSMYVITARNRIGIDQTVDSGGRSSKGLSLASHLNIRQK